MSFPVMKGRTWKFGDNISTDLMMPWVVMQHPEWSREQMAEYVMYSNRPGWAAMVETGDIIVGGKNYGCGSDRPAATPLKALGISCVIAESVARLFFRNSINLGFPVLAAPGIQGFCEEGDVLEVDLEGGKIRNLTEKKTMTAETFPEGTPPMQILKAGGLIKLLEREYRKKGGA